VRIKRKIVELEGVPYTNFKKKKGEKNSDYPRGDWAYMGFSVEKLVSSSGGVRSAPRAELVSWLQTSGWWCLRVAKFNSILWERQSLGVEEKVTCPLGGKKNNFFMPTVVGRFFS